MEVPIVVALISAIVTAAGWLVVNFLAARRADKTRRLELMLQHHERQIEEFYGPIMILIQRVWNIWRIREEIFEKMSPEDNARPLDEIKRDITRFVYENYFSTIHKEIAEIIKEKAYLIDGAILPQSFNDYLAHSIMQEIQNRLWYEKSMSTQSVPEKKWPYEFPKDIERGFNSSMNSYQNVIETLAH
jgi:hypothetical protein